jgi:ABC-type nitrate/sulfonate/bicarbonate transport system permease component
MPYAVKITLNRVGLLLLAMVLAVVIWSLFLRVFDISTLIGKTPTHVLEYLFSDDDAAENRAEVLGFLGETARDFGIGYLVGITTAFVLAVLFSLSPSLENILMPTAMVLRCIPVIILTPLITLVFGVGVPGVAAIVTLVVFLPALANVLHGLRAAQERHGDLVRAYGGSGLDLLWKVALPGSVPSVLASARISIPAAVTGAMIGEWLATGDGLGGFISRSSGSFGYDAMWASAVVITGTTMIAYTVVSIVDALVQKRFDA